MFGSHGKLLRVGELRNVEGEVAPMNCPDEDTYRKNQRNIKARGLKK